MSFPIGAASPSAISKITAKRNEETGLFDDKFGVFISTKKQTKYPLDELRIAESFTVPITEANEQSLRVAAYTKARLTGKEFTVVKHVAHGLIEVARIA